MENQALTRQTNREQSALPEKWQNQESKTNDFLQKYLKTGIVKVKSDNVLAIRQNSLKVSNTDPVIMNLALNKAILDSFSYFNTVCPDNLLKLLISDIKEIYHEHSPVELLEAINQGRKNQDVNSIYGKLSAAHIMQWLRDFDIVNTERIKAEYLKQQEQEKEEQERIMHDEKGQSIFLTSGIVKKRPVKEFNKHEMAIALSSDPVYQKHILEQRKIKKYNDYLSKYDKDKHGDYKTYMENYDKNCKK